MSEQQEKAFGFVAFNTGKCEWEFFAEFEYVPLHGYAKPKPVYLAPPSVEALQAENSRLEAVSGSFAGQLAKAQTHITTLEATNAAQAERIDHLEKTLFKIVYYAKQQDVLAEFWYLLTNPLEPALLQSSTPAESQLAGGEAVAIRVVAPDGRVFLHEYKGQDIAHWATLNHKAERLYTGAPAIKQQVAEDTLCDMQAAAEALEKIAGGMFLDDGIVLSVNKFTMAKRLAKAAAPRARRAFEAIAATPTHPVSANQPDGGWQPIETAPKDGTVILALECWIYHTDAARRPHYILREVFYNDEGGWEIVEDGEVRDDDGFTHWLPRNVLPAAPSDSVEEGK